MMLQKKRINFKNILHSIPIGSIMVLLLLLGFLISPNIYYSNNSVYAVEEDDIEGNSNIPNNSENDVNNHIEKENANSADISTQANVTSASATLSIDNNANGTSYSEPGETIYRTHNVDVHVNDVTSYNLSISYGADANNTLNYEGSSKNPPIITGANNVAGNSLENNTWGYYWDTNNSTDTSILNYSTMPNYNASETILTESNSNNIAYNKTINGKLIFAAKFAEDAPYGHYKTSVLLSLAATPQNITTYSVTYNCNEESNCPENFSTESTELTYTYTIPNITPTKEGYTFLGYSTSSGSTTVEYNPNSTISLNSSSPSRELFAVWEENEPAVTGFGGIKKMQDMTSAICNSVATGTAGQLYDTRDKTIYKIKKLQDNKCWMNQNLKLDLNNQILTTTDSNIDSEWTSSTGASTKWTTPRCTSGEAQCYSVIKYYNGSGEDGYKSEYGYYYSWGAATAGRASKFTASSTKDITQDICPKNWRMPTKSEYDTLISKDEGWDNTLKGRTLGGGFFPVAGYLYGGDDFRGIESSGQYWSSTAPNAATAYRLALGSSVLSTGDGTSSFRYTGHNMRCVAK